MKFMLKLLRFGEGGDGGAGSAAGEASNGGETSGVEIPASIPERGRKLFAEVMKQKSAPAEAPKETVQAEETTKESKLTYDELIKSDEYKDAHREYMEKTLNDRLKKYKGQEASLKEARNLLNTIGTKYGLDSEDKDYLSKLKEAVENDDSYYEKYADEHDMTPAEARKIVSLERRLKETEAAQQRAAQEEAQRAQFETVRQNATKTQAMYPNFDFASELQNPNFVRILSATNGDTTAAYIATHHDDIIRGVAASAAQQAQVATAQTIAAGVKRPAENGISGTASSDVKINFKDMSLEQIRKYADEQRRIQARKR